MSFASRALTGSRALELRRLLRFACVGLSGFLINTLVLYLLTEHGGLHYLVSSAIATEIAILSNFILNHRWTFRGVRRARALPLSFARFNAVSVGGLLITVASLFALTHVFGLYYLAANPIGIGIATVWNYGMCRRWIWRGAPEPRGVLAHPVATRTPEAAGGVR